MKKRKLILIMVLMLTLKATYSQERLPADSLIKNLNLNFAVPDLPAFSALETKPGNLLRPSAPRNLFVDGEI